MRNKTADEVANLSNQMYAELVRQQPRAASPQGQAQQTQYNAASPTAPSNDLWITDPATAAAQYAAYVQATQIAPMVGGLTQQLGTTSREVVKLRYPEEFRKWGPEIELYINQTAPEYRTVDNLEKILGLVRANHIDEIAAERAQKRLDEMLNSGAVLRPGTAGAGVAAAAPNGTIDFKTAGLPPEYSRVLDTYRITPAVLDEFLLKTSANGDPSALPAARAKWLENAKRGDVIVEQKTDTLVSALGGAS